MLAGKKLALVLDLDQTLVHSVPGRITDDFGVHLVGDGYSQWLVRLRPGTEAFLKSVAEMYELHVNTHATREYARSVVRLLDPTGELFGGRITSRDDTGGCRMKMMSCSVADARMALAVDDRMDVWEIGTTLLSVSPYYYFGCEPTIDQDVQLVFLQHTLRSIHEEYFKRHTKGGGDIVNVADIVEEKRARVLDGCVLRFILRGSRRKQEELMWRASCLGAVPGVSPTHIVTNTILTADEVSGGVHVVQPSWVNDSFVMWRKCCEKAHQLHWDVISVSGP